MPRSLKKITLVVSFQIIGLVFGLLAILVTKTSAQSSQQRLVTGDVVACTTNSSSYYDTLSQPVSGAVYARLPAGSSPSVVYLYSENTSNSTCLLLGAAKIESGHWLFLGSGSSITNIMIQVPNASARPSTASVADLLAVPNSDICAPVINCNINYQGDRGYLVPNNVPDTSKQITVYDANTITDVRFSSINYYADGTFLYSSTQLRPINRDYLAGGKHHIFIQVNFINGEKVNISQVVNMGIDWGGSLKLRSAYYRSHNKLVFSLIVVVILILLVIALWQAWKAYKRHQPKIDHGIDEYEGLDMIDPSPPRDDDPPNDATPPSS